MCKLLTAANADVSINNGPMNSLNCYSWTTSRCFLVRCLSSLQSLLWNCGTSISGLCYDDVLALSIPTSLKRQTPQKPPARSKPSKKIVTRQKGFKNKHSHQSSFWRSNEAGKQWRFNSPAYACLGTGIRAMHPSTSKI